MLLTLCTARQLRQALALADSFVRHNTSPATPAALIALVDDPTHLPAGFVSPYPLLPITDVLPPDRLATLSAMYTPTEFAAACKPHVIQHVFQHYPQVDRLLYADPNCQFYASVEPVWTALATANVLLTPHITQSPATGPRPGPVWPDEKFFQNVGLYSADFLAFRQSAETDRLLAWWQDRVTERAYIDYCAGLCTDQLWLMHVPVFFRDVRVEKNPGWHVALWNLPERTLRPEGTSWLVTNPAGERHPLLFVNFKGLLNPDEGFFPHQNRLRPASHVEVQTLLSAYKVTLRTHQILVVQPPQPAYGQRPEPVVLRGWRQTTAGSLRTLARFIDQVPLPVIR